MEAWKSLVLLVLGLGCFLLVVLLPLSLHRVSANEVAISYDKVSRKVGSSILREGLHALTPSSTLIKFSTTVRSTTWSNEPVLTKDALSLNLTLHVTYIIDQERVFDIFDTFGTQDAHDEFLATLIEMLLRVKSAEYAANEFYLEREVYQQGVQQYFSEQFDLLETYAIISYVQVVNIDFPLLAQQSLTSTAVAQQDISNAGVERAQQIQAAQIRLLQAQQTADLIQIDANRQVASIDQQTQQAVLQIRNQWNLRTEAFVDIASRLGGDGEFFVDSYIQGLVLTSNSGKNVLEV